MSSYYPHLWSGAPVHLEQQNGSCLSCQLKCFLGHKLLIFLQINQSVSFAMPLKLMNSAGKHFIKYAWPIYNTSQIPSDTVNGVDFNILVTPPTATPTLTLTHTHTLHA